ncbi:UvrD-helicase domain-containing protein [Sphaerisporangium sp. NPDC088356]|uniref:UvrD-helicase domain-containing protein n=1 Tax=Sphaerisporangium sp. NPDC088356 TaxID=3154871 RepID=UPI0034259AC2
MQSHNNRAVIAAAGSGKTQHIIDCVLKDPTRRTLVTTYTNENLRQLTERLAYSGGGVIPRLVTTMGWYTFLMNQCARPYQSAVLSEAGIMRGLNFVGERPRFASKNNPKFYYLDSNKAVYRNEVAALAVEANRLSGGKVVDRLAAMYDHIYIDEVQDMTGHDLELLDLLLASPIATTLVGDPRQATTPTNNSSKNKKFKGGGIAAWLYKRADMCVIDERVESHRCNQAICDFADSLYPDLPQTVSMNEGITGHDGIFDIRPEEVSSYVERYAPVVLRHQKNSDTQGLDAMNFGVSKGSTFDRVLIFPTKPMTHYYHNRDPEKAGDLARLYVAVTRARYSVAFVIP